MDIEHSGATTIESIGHHNADPEGSAARLIKGATWKKQRIIVIIPAAKTMSSKVALSLWNLMFPPNNNVFRFLAEGLEVGDAYSTALDAILAHPELKDWEYVLTIEHDNLPQGDGVLKLLERMEATPEVHAMSGLYWTKGEGGVPQIWGDPNDAPLNFRPQPAQPGELIECCGIGMGFALWRLSMFKDERLPKPLFRTRASKEEGVYTQDLAFWEEARKYGYRCAVDCAVLVGHMDLATGKVW